MFPAAARSLNFGKGLAKFCMFFTVPARTLFFLILTFSFASCSRQEKIELSIINRSASKIDSVIFPFRKEKGMHAIDPGQTKSVTIFLAPEQLKGEGLFTFYIYQNGKQYLGTYGFHDWGHLEANNYAFYFFDNGINVKDDPPEQPREFSIFVVDRSSVAADSIRAKPESAIRVIRLSTCLKIVVDFAKFRKDPVLKVSRNGIAKDLHIDHDWTNWNTAQEIIYINEDGLVAGK